MTTRKYFQGSQDEIRKEMNEYKHGEAHIGKKAKNRKQPVSIGSSKARPKR